MPNYEGEKTPLFISQEESSGNVVSSFLKRLATPWIARSLAAIAAVIFITIIILVIRKHDDGGYSLDLAQSLVYHAEAAYYCRSSSNCTCSTCVRRPSMTNDTVLIKDVDLDLWGYVTHDDNLKAIIISFAGTGGTSTTNWEHNLNWLLVDLPACEGCQIHNGFQINYAALQPQVKSAVDDFISKYPDVPILVTGHSMGGAMTTLCVVDLVLNQKRKVKASYTYGSPRVGNHKFAKAFAHWTTEAEAPLFRLTHAGDPVVSAPWTSLGYQHTPREAPQIVIVCVMMLRVFYIRNPRRYRVCNDASGEHEDPQCAASFENVKFSTMEKNQKHLFYMNQNMGNDDILRRRLDVLEGDNHDPANGGGAELLPFIDYMDRLRR